MTMKRKRILFTGGSGKAGRHVVPWLLDAGYQINVDLTPLDHPGVDNTADITDSGQMFNVLTSYANFDELEPGTGVPRFDAVVHFAAYPDPAQADNETFRVNTVGTYNVIEAATKLGIDKIIVASSETTYGVCFADGQINPDSLPLEEEDYDVNPTDSYALSKLVNEQTARSFARRTGADIYALRIGNVIEPHEYAENFPGYFENPAVRRRNAFCYIDARDLGRSYTFAFRKTGWVFRSSAPATTTTRPTFPAPSSSNASSPEPRSRGSWGAMKRSIQIGKSGRFSVL